MKIKSLKCPYCGYDLGLTETFLTKEKETYKCKECKEVSNVTLDSKIKVIVFLLIAIYIAIIFIFSAIVKRYVLGSLIIVFISVLFYGLVPLFIELRKNN